MVDGPFFVVVATSIITHNYFIKLPPNTKAETKMKVSTCNILLASAIIAVSTVDARGGLRTLKKDVSSLVRFANVTCQHHDVINDLIRIYATSRQDWGTDGYDHSSGGHSGGSSGKSGKGSSGKSGKSSGSSGKSGKGSSSSGGWGSSGSSSGKSGKGSSGKSGKGSSGKSGKSSSGSGSSSGGSSGDHGYGYGKDYGYGYSDNAQPATDDATVRYHRSIRLIIKVFVTETLLFSLSLTSGANASFR